MNKFEFKGCKLISSLSSSSPCTNGQLPPPLPPGQVTARSLADQEIKKVSQALEELDYVFSKQRVNQFTEH